MKLKLCAVLAVVAAAFAYGGVAQAGPPGPQDHDWTVTLSTYDPGGNPDVTVNLKLGTASSPSALFPTPFFDTATTTYTGITPATPNVGAEVGQVNFSIQTNQAVPPIPGNIKPNGQPPRCGETGTLTVQAPPFKIYAARKDLAADTVSTLPDPSNSPFTFDQGPDTANGGAPKAVTHKPDWYAPVLSLIGIPDTLVVSRAYGIATAVAGASYTSVNFLTINTTGGRYAAVTVLANPIAAFNPASQTAGTCPPFESTVQTLGVSAAKTWNCVDYFGSPVSGCSGTFTGSSSTVLTLASSGTHSYQIALSGGANLDNDADPGGTPLFGAWDNCDVDPNPTQADANNNGIGDACKTGGTVWTNVSPTAVTNAQLTCTTINTSPPWQPCQDADQDEALNSVDNCPLTPNTEAVTPGDNQKDTDRDGIGDACDPQPLIRGDGAGYASTLLPAGTGTYADYDDICDHPFTIGGGSIGPAGVCINAAAWPVNLFVDSNDDGAPDYFNPGSGQPCVQDHRADSNGDGYSDSDHVTPFGSVTCTGSYPNIGSKSAKVGNDPLKACPNRPPQSSASARAKADVNLDGQVNIQDLLLAAGFYQQQATQSTAALFEADQNNDRQVNIQDLLLMAGHYQQQVVTCQ